MNGHPNMTAGEKENHKEKLRKVMVDHLTIIGYPNISGEQIIAELKNMWIKIEEAGLVVEDMKFVAFQAIANNELLMSQVRNMMGF